MFPRPVLFLMVNTCSGTVKLLPLKELPYFGDWFKRGFFFVQVILNVRGNFLAIEELKTSLSSK